MGNENFRPRWHTRPQNTVHPCGVSTCKQSAQKKTSISLSLAENVFNEPLATFEVTNDSNVVNVRLCCVHYSSLYCFLHQPTPCAACNCLPIKGEQFKRHCTSVDIINTYEQVVKKRLDFVLTGCGCKTGCTNKRCKCLKQQQACGPGCRCVGCRNSHKSPESSTSKHNESSAMEHSHVREAALAQQPREDDVHHLELEDMIDSQKNEEYVDDDSDVDIVEEDTELDELMDRIFCDTANGDGYDSEEHTDFL